MKIAFLSDIHGNAVALDAVLADINGKNVDKICVLGDLCYRGPEPKRSLELVQSLRTDVIKGNADEWVVRGVQEGEVPEHVLEMMNNERDWTVSQLEPVDLEYLSNLPSELTLNVNGRTVHAFHATPSSLFDIVPPDADEEILQQKLMFSKDAQIYVYAHIHRPYIRNIQGKIIINIGSVGLPFDGLQMASYALIEIKNIGISTAIERVHFDTNRVMAQYEKVNYPNAEMMKRVVQNARLG